MTDEEFLASLTAALTVQPVYEYRVYYDNNGRVTEYTTQQPPGNYIVITAEQWAECNMNAVVKNGRLVHPRYINRTYALTKNLTDGVQTSKYDISVLDNGPETVYWTTTTYDIDTE